MNFIAKVDCDENPIVIAKIGGQHAVEMQLPLRRGLSWSSHLERPVALGGFERDGKYVTVHLRTKAAPNGVRVPAVTAYYCEMDLGTRYCTDENGDILEYEGRKEWLSSIVDAAMTGEWPFAHSVFR